MPRRRTAAVVAALLATACDRTPTGPRAPAARPQSLQVSATAIVAQDLGVLPGDESSEATHVTEDGTVYGVSYPAAGTSRLFRWTPDGGMVQVSSIPQPSSPPWEALLSVPFPWVKGIVTARNAKGEATGVLCEYDCADPTTFGGHVFRSSAGAGVTEIDTRRFDPTLPDVPDGSSHGWSINRWGHVAGAYWLFDDPSAFLWTPVDSFRIDAFIGNDNGNTRLNDVDQVLAQGQDAVHEFAFVFRPDLDRRELVPDAVSLSYRGVEWNTYALAQQRNGTLVVGRSVVFVNDDEAGVSFFREHAALWRVPALDRAAFPAVDANVYGVTSAPSFARSGGLYYQLYRATQASAAGPYLELVDWGDGTSSRRTRSRIGVTTSQSHTYARAGSYWVRVYVKDVLGRWGVSEHKVTFRP